MSVAFPENAMSKEYRGDYPEGSAANAAIDPTKRRLLRAGELADNPELLAELFRTSVTQNLEHFSGPEFEKRPNPEPFFGKDRDPKKRKRVYEPGLNNTPEVGELMAAEGSKRWEVLGADDLSFYYLERELLVTQDKGARQEPETASIGLRIDLLLANAHDGVPIVGEVKVTQEETGKPDENPYYALIQAMACASYLLPRWQLARLHRHDSRKRLITDSGKLDLYIVTVREPPASKAWFKLRDEAERLSAGVVPLISNWVRTIAFVDLAWLDKPGREEKRPPRVTKRFAVRG